MASAQVKVLSFLFVIIVLITTTAALGQQEIDPTWYNPWPAQNLLPQTRPPRHVNHKPQKKSASSCHGRYSEVRSSPFGAQRKHS